MAPTDEVAAAPEVVGKGEKDEKKNADETTVTGSSIHSRQASGQQHDGDVEKHGAGPESSPLPALKRKLKSRHLQMIAIGQSMNLLSCIAG